MKVSRRNKFLIAAISLTALLFLSIQLNINSKNVLLRHEVTIFDKEKLDGDFDVVFSRMRPYLNHIVNHYSSTSTTYYTGSKIAMEFNEAVKEYSNSVSSDAAFVSLTRIVSRDTFIAKASTILRELIESGAGALTLSAFLLIPMNSGVFSKVQSAMMKSRVFREDRLLAYLASLRLPNIHRGFFILKMWMDRYYTTDFSSKFGNPLSYPREESTFTRFMNAFDAVFKVKPEFLQQSRPFSLDEIILHSTAPITILEYKNEVRLDVTLKELIKKEFITSTTEALVIKTKPSVTKNFVQIPEIIFHGSTKYTLKFMALERNGKPAIMIFDGEFQVWTLFDGEKTILSFPRQFARKYYNETGTHLLYIHM